jgi:aminoglycoside/choline kinase family phosphotransferase
MKSPEENIHTRQILDFLQKENIVYNGEKVSLSPLAGDGSSRRFFRIKTEVAGSFCGVLPGPENAKKGMAEARAAFHIGSHLKKRGIPVPAIHAYNPENGLILFEDLGETLLHDELARKRERNREHFWQQATKTYKEIIELLLYMQISGSVHFDRKWCWDTPRYDKKLMLEKESGYFLQAFCRDLLGIKSFPEKLTGEFKELAGRAARQPAVYFLHRDFQSRNLMVLAGEIRIIDFQGGRLGPLGYDLASILIDPYVQMPAETQQELLEHYLEQLCTYGLDDRAFLKGYTSLALQRNLQILGAFAFLANRRQKVFFTRYIQPATLSLRNLLAGPGGNNYPHLLQLAENILELLPAWNRPVPAAPGKITP